MEQSAKAEKSLRVYNASQLVCISLDPQISKKCGAQEMNEIVVLRDAGFLCRGGKIIDIGTEEELKSRLGDDSHFDEVFDATGKVIIPGLVDGHTHPIWSGDRVHEFVMKLRGATYLEIHQAGGGIGFTVQKTDESSDDELLQKLQHRLRRMVRHGTTTAEAKTGYGLSLEKEMRLLRLLTQAARAGPLDLAINYCAAHSVPKGRSADEYIDEVCDKHLPLLAELKQKHEVDCDMVDIFCERNVFSAEHTRKLMDAAAQFGLRGNFHGDELSYTGSCELAAECKVCWLLNAEFQLFLTLIHRIRFVSLSTHSALLFLIANMLHLRASPRWLQLVLLPLCYQPLPTSSESLTLQHAP